MLKKLYQELSNFQERMHRRSKAKFREYLKSKAIECNLPYQINPQSFASKNVIIGDFQKAEYILGAHYDTPPWMPSFLMKSVLFFNIVLIIIILSLIVATFFGFNKFLAIFLYLIIIIYLLGFFSIANKYNYNDNTSGVMTLLYLMTIVKNQKVAYAFFDNEEKGLIGSMQLAMVMKKMRNQCKKKLIIFDCVGRGNVFRLSSSRQGFAQELKRTFAQDANNEISYEVKKSSYLEGSDHLAFQNYDHVGIMCFQKKGKKYVLNDIHSHKDREINLSNIEVLSSSLKRYLDKEEFNG